jgi:hypothetical protein
MFENVFYSISCNALGMFRIRNFYMPFARLGFIRHWSSMFAVLLPLTAPISFCQTPAPAAAAQSQAAQPPVKPSDLLHPALNQINQTIVALNISRWKAPGEVRAGTQQNVDSIQRDLNNTLPGLLATADAASGTVSAIFPVYRNIDALYDVLLRVSQTGNLAAPQNEATSITSALEKLESARADLGTAILNASRNNEAEVIRLQTAIQQAAAAKAATPPKTTIVNDGPTPSTSTAKKRKKPSTSSGTTPPPQ